MPRQASTQSTHQTISATTDLDRSLQSKGELRCFLLQSRHSRPQQRPTATHRVRLRLAGKADHGLWRVTTRNQLWENVFRTRLSTAAHGIGSMEPARRGAG